jgi:hypothetical protein
MGTIRLTQIDGKLPNLALMKLSYWHKEKGDDVIFKHSINRELFEPDYDRVYGSAIFTSSLKKIEMFKKQFPEAIVGGSAVDMFNPKEEQLIVESIIGCEEYEYENYDYSIYPDFKHSIGFTQRGCRMKCSFCGVPRKEGANVVVNTIADLWRAGTEKKLHLLDNDFFGQKAWRERCEEIIDGGFKVCFNQGINVRLIHKEGAEYLVRMKFMDDQFKKKRIYTAWDNRGDEKAFDKGINILLGAGIRPSNIMVYMLCGYWPRETWDDIFYRLNKMKQMGLMPYPMIYMENNGSKLDKKRLKQFQRYVITRLYQWTDFEDYLKMKMHKTNERQEKLFELLSSEIKHP